jgi:hypothetical protein
MKNITLIIITVLILGCSHRTHTGKLWNKVDEFVVIEEKYLNESQNNTLKSKVGNDVKYDGIGRYYIRKSTIERIALTPMIIVVTPFTIAMDGVTWVVGGVLDLKNTKGSTGVPDRMAASAIESLINIL